MVRIPKNIENELLKSESRFCFLEVVGLTYEDALDIVKQAEDIKGWEAYPICNLVNYDVFFVRTPMDERKNAEKLIKNARVNFREESYVDAIKFANEYLRSKNNPDHIVYALIGIAYLRRIRQIRINMANKPLSEEEKDKLNAEIDAHDRYANEYLRLYSYFNGRVDSEIKSLGIDLITFELEQWLDNIPEVKKETPLQEKINDLDLDILNEVNDKIARSTEIKTIEQVGKISFEKKDRAKIAYARVAIRANLPLIAKKYIDCVANTPNRSRIVDAKLALAREELRFMKLSDDGSKNKNVRRLIESTNNQPCRLVFVKPGKRINKAS